MTRALRPQVLVKPTLFISRKCWLSCRRQWTLRRFSASATPGSRKKAWKCGERRNRTRGEGREGGLDMMAGEFCLPEQRPRSSKEIFEAARFPQGFSGGVESLSSAAARRKTKITQLKNFHESRPGYRRIHIYDLIIPALEIWIAPASGSDSGGAP